MLRKIYFKLDFNYFTYRSYLLQLIFIDLSDALQSLVLIFDHAEVESGDVHMPVNDKRIPYNQFIIFQFLAPTLVYFCEALSLPISRYFWRVYNIHIGREARIPAVFLFGSNFLPFVTWQSSNGFLFFLSLLVFLPSA